MAAKNQLTSMQEKFLDNLVQGKLMIDAYLEAGYQANSRKKASARAQEMLKKPHIQAELQKRKKELKERNNLNVDVLVKRLLAIADADMTKIMRIVQYNCRYCWGFSFKYQSTDREYEEAQTRAEEFKVEFDERGGGGFNPVRPPHPDCPECGGKGIKDIDFTPTDQLGPRERVLYAGAEYTRQGIKVKTHDQYAALLKLIEHAGGFESKTAERLREMQLRKLEAEANALEQTQVPIAVNIHVQDASNPDRIKGQQLNVNDGESEPEHTSE